MTSGTRMHLDVFMNVFYSFFIYLWFHVCVCMILCVCGPSFKNGLSSFSEAEELYQKRILTISGICIALLVVGIMCVVAYCKTK